MPDQMTGISDQMAGIDDQVRPESVIRSVRNTQLEMPTYKIQARRRTCMILEALELNRTIRSELTT